MAHSPSKYPGNAQLARKAAQGRIFGQETHNRAYQSIRGSCARSKKVFGQENAPLEVITAEVLLRESSRGITDRNQRDSLAVGSQKNHGCPDPEQREEK
jgi:hypothetical protein